VCVCGCVCGWVCSLSDQRVSIYLYDTLYATLLSFSNLVCSSDCCALTCASVVPHTTVSYASVPYSCNGTGCCGGSWSPLNCARNAARSLATTLAHCGSCARFTLSVAASILAPKSPA
jgi:hypothetical protein